MLVFSGECLRGTGMAAQTQTALTILRRKQVEVKTGLHRSTIYDRINPTGKWHDPDFPRPVSIGRRSVGWLESEIDAWLTAQIEKSRGLD
jgi:prophage regulatory protein